MPFHCKHGNAEIVARDEIFGQRVGAAAIAVGMKDDVDVEADVNGRGVGPCDRAELFPAVIAYVVGSLGAAGRVHHCQMSGLVE